jgi:succinate dehydrogenase/fumarate reductase cytochrome b subunit
MTIRHESTSHTSDAATGALPRPWQRLLALSGVAFAPLFVVGWLTSSVANAPDYTAADEKWIKWARDDHIKGRVSSFALVLAAFVFIYFLGALRSVLEEAESSVRGSKELARVAFAGALTGIVGMTMAFVSIANASAPAANAEPVVSKAVTTSAAGPFLVGAVGFSAFLLATGVLTLRTGVLARWTGFLALVGSACFFITLLTILNNSGSGSAFGYAFFPAVAALVIWTIATSIGRYRALAT